jgi:glycosyltransferase involved in cell wall biosynthesis
MALVRHMKIDKFISFEGYQSNTKMYYEMFDFIILPSVSEGCSYNVIEAMTYGVPIVLSDVGGNHELITDDTNGLLFKYSGIRDLEERTVYIDNYNEHLQTIGYIIEKYGQKFWYTEEMKFLEAFLIDAVCPIYAYSDDSIKYAEIKKKQSTWLKNADVLTYNIDKMINLSDAEIHQFIQKNINFIDSKFNENIYVKQILELFK